MNLEQHGLRVFSVRIRLQGDNAVKIALSLSKCPFWLIESGSKHPRGETTQISIKKQILRLDSLFKPFER